MVYPYMKIIPRLSHISSVLLFIFLIKFHLLDCNLNILNCTEELIPNFQAYTVQKKILG